jgi:signal transduction histidine kinase
MLKFELFDPGERDVAVYRSLRNLRAEADRDLARRSIAGVFSYFALWLIIYYASELEHANDALLEFLGFMLAAASVGRLYLAWWFNVLYASHPRRWRWLFGIGTTMSAAIWGGVSALALNYDGLGTTSVMVMLSAAGIAASGIVSLAPAASLGAIFVVLLLLPIVPSALSTGTPSEKAVALLFLIFFTLMLFLSRRLHVEYWRALAGRTELVRAKEEAEAATAAKGQFIASVSHELRTPLTAIIGALGLIESDLPDGMPPPAMKLIDMAYQNGRRLSVLINDLLDFEKLAAGRMEFQIRRLSLAPFLERALDLNHFYADTHNVSLALEQPLPDVTVSADDQRLMQVMANLLSNAVKYSPTGGTVRVSACLAKDRVRISVSDRGPGVLEAFRKHIFQEFAQAESSNTRKTAGTGLGLAISKAIVERMGGTIGFESVAGQGATFYFDLPLALPT